MFRPSRMPSRGHGVVARQLAKLPSGTRVQMQYGSVWVKYVRRWMVAGVIRFPTTSPELARLNAGMMPVQLSPAWEPTEVTP